MRANLALALLASSWGFISVIVAGLDLEGEALAFYRLALASAALAAGLALLGRFDLFQLPVLRVRTVLVGVLLGAHWLLFFVTIKLSSVAVAVLTVYTAPVFLAALAPLVLPERRSRIALAALVPASVGIALIGLAAGEAERLRPLGVATGIAAAFSYAILVIGTKHLAARLPVPTIEVWYFTVAALVLAPFLAAGDRVLPRADEVGYLVLLGVVFTAASGLAYVWLLARVTAQAAGVLSYLEPVSAALLAWAILGEPITAGIAAGGILVVGAGVLVVLLEPPDAVPGEPPSARPLVSASGRE